MPLPNTARTRRDRPYLSAHAAHVAARILAMAADPSIPAPRSPDPTLPSRGQAAFDRIMAACMPGTAPAEVAEVRPVGVQPPPPRKPRRR